MAVITKTFVKFQVIILDFFAKIYNHFFESKKWMKFNCLKILFYQSIKNRPLYNL